MSGGGRDLTSLFVRMCHDETEAVAGAMYALSVALHRLGARHRRVERCWLKTRLHSRPRA
jgi:hypothetical protein